MRLLTSLLSVTWVFVLAGCASNESVRRSIATIGTEVSLFQADLSGFQTEVKTYLDDETARIAGSSARRELALAMARRQQVEWSVMRARTESELFAALQAQGREETLRLAEPAAPALKAPSVALPFDKLSAVAASLDQLSKEKGARAELEFLLKYGATVSKQLKALEESEKKAAQAAGSAPAKK